MNVYLITVIAYLVAMSAIGIWRSRRVRGQNDFMIAERHVSTFMMIMTLIVTWTGAGSLIGGAGLAYRQGFSELWMAVGAWVAILVIYRLAGRVRHIGGYTLPDILEKRYNSAARALGSIALIIGCTTIVGYQLKGGAYILNLVADVPTQNGIVIMAAMTILVTALAGMRSIVAIDIMNGVLVLLGICVAVPLLVMDLGGPSAVIAALPQEHFSLFGGHGAIWAAAVFFPVFFLLLGEPSMYQKFFSAKNERTAKRAAIGWIIGIIIIDTLICTLAVLGRIKFPDLGADGHAERVILDIARFGLPTWAGCMLLASGIAIVFSTANSFLLAPATNLTHDIIQRFLAKGMNQRLVVIVSRTSTVVLGIIAYVLLTKFRNVLTMALYAYTMIGAGLTPAILAAFFWKRVTTAGGIASIIGGMVGTIATKVVFDLPNVQAYFETHFAIPGAELGEYIIIPAFLLATILLIFVSLIGKKPAEEKWKVFFEKQ
ncbi:MAG: sodium:solute symporter family protein [Pseudomonadota bacterium]